MNDDFGLVTGASVFVKGTSNGCITDCISQCIFRRNLGHFIHWLSNTRSSGKQLAEVFHQLKRGLTTTARSSGMAMGYGDVRCKHLTGSIVKADIKLFGDIPKKIKCKRVHFILNKYMTCSIKHLISVITLTDSYFILIKVSNTNTSDIGKGLKSII